MGLRRFRALVSWLPPDSALARVMAMDAEASPAAPPPAPAAAPQPRKVFDLDQARAFAAKHGGRVNIGH